MTDEDAADRGIVDPPAHIEIAEPRLVLQFVKRPRPHRAEIDQQQIIGLRLMVRPLAPGFDQDVGVMVAFGKGRADPEECKRKHGHLPAS